MLDSLIQNTKDKTKNQMKTLTQTILPRIAMYKVLLAENITEEASYEYIRKYMMEKVPGFYGIYSKIFLKFMKKTDLQESTQKKEKTSFDVTITKCLWHTACVENGCATLCRLFCDVDDVTYGNLKKLGFSRTKTLGYGGDCCDFHFFKK